VRYEVLLADPETEFLRLARFLNLSVSSERISEIVRWTSMKALKGRERRDGWNHYWPSDKQFFRRGIAGSFKDEMPAEVLEEFEARYGNELEALGYQKVSQKTGVPV
jgi:hypothetical protein